MPLQDSDNFIIGRGTDSYKITYQDLKDDLNYVPPPTGTIDTPTVLEPNDGAGGGDARYLKSDAITEVEGSGVSTCETDTIQSVDDTDPANVVLTFPSSNGFECFESGDVVQGGGLVWVAAFSEGIPAGNSSTPQTYDVEANAAWVDGIDTPISGNYSIYFKNVKDVPIDLSQAGFWIWESETGATWEKVGTNPNQIYTPSTKYFSANGTFSGVKFAGVVKVVSQDEDANTITVDGGTWTTSDKLVKETPYDTKLTVAGSTDLADMSGSTFMSDGTGAPGPYSQTPYKLTTTDIESVAESPYWNQDARWRNGLTVVGNFGGGPDFAFNGDMGNNASSATGGATITFTCPVAFSAGVKLEAKCNRTGGGSHWISVNGGAEFQVFGADVGADGFHELPYQPGDEQAFVITFRNNTTGGGTDLTGIRVGGQLLVDDDVAGPGPTGGSTLTFPGDVSTNPDLQYFKAGDEVQSGVSVISTGYPDSNTMVVDGGNWLGKSTTLWDQRPGVIWSNALEVVGGDFFGPTPKERAFNGDLDNYAASSTNKTIRWTSPVAFPEGSKLELFFNTSETYTTTVTVNGNTPVSYSGTSFVEIPYTAGAEAGFVIEMIADNAASNTNWTAVKINDLLLVDDGVAGAPVNGDTHVEYQTNGGEGTIVSVNTTDNTIALNDTGDRDNRWIIGFSVAGPSVIDDPLLTNDVQLRSSDFATTPPDVDTLKEIIWSINGIEYSAGVTNPWSPLEKLPTNSTVTVKVKYKGNTLEDSDWSPNVTFTTGASIRSLFTRIAALEADEITDDATDTALLTLIAGLAQRIQALEESN